MSRTAVAFLTVLALAVCVFALTPDLQARAGGDLNVRGTITGINYSAQSFTVTRTNGTKVNLTANAASKIFVNDAPAPFASLKVGQTADVDYYTNHVARRIEAKG